MILLGIDLETDSLEMDCNVLEVGAVLFDWNTKSPVKMISALIDPKFNSDDEYEVPAEITEITGITTDQIRDFGQCEGDVLGELTRMEAYMEFYVGHNCNSFDAPRLQKAFERCGIVNAPRAWIDTSLDIKFPPLIKTRNLRHLAAEHGFINPFPHRAVTDVLTMFKVMACYDLDAIIARSKEPTVYVQACVSFDEKEKAKERGYRWYAPTKLWWKGMKSSDAEIEVAECGFRTNRLERAPE